jgi:two-component system sensor histidine kinase TctE
MPSIRLHLLKWLIGPILLINLAGGVLTYMLAWLPAQIAFDQSLSDATGALGARLAAQDGAWHIDLPPQAEQVLRNDDTDAVYFIVRDSAGRALAGDAEFPALRNPAKPAAPLAYDGELRGEAVRIATRRVDGAAGPAYVGVAKTLRKRTQIRQAIFRALVLLDGLFMLACVGLIWFSVTNGLRPLERMRSALNARGAGQLAPIEPAGVPYELEAVVQAFNGLLARVSEGAQAQQDFLANVAHQLRTPLAGLQTQLEWLGDRHAEPDTAHSIRLMRLSTERMVRQTNQLLALARAEPSHFEQTRLEPLRLDELVAETIQHFVEQAARKAIDLGFELAPAEVMGDRFLLRDLIDNLIDNAIRYTPDGGVVTVRCRGLGDAIGTVAGRGGVLEVEDSGPGIAPALRAAVFQRYVRLDHKTSGNGLGLAIVRDIAAAHAARIAIDSAPDGRGALFSVYFPS